MNGAAYEEVRLLLEANKYPPQVIGAFRAEVAATIEGYPGELAALRGTLAAIRTTVQHGGMDDVRSLVTEYYADEHAAYAEQGEKDTPTGTTSTPHHERDRCMHGTSFNVECGGCDALGQIGGGAV